MSGHPLVPPSWLSLPVALAIGAGGGWAATRVGLPAPWLIGAAVAVTLASLGPLKTQTPNWLRDGAFAVIGLSIGSGVDETILGRAVAWAPSLVAVVACTIAVMVASSAFLERFGGIDPATARLASSPGALGYAVSAAMEGHGDLTQVMVIQSFRLFSMTAILPPLLALSGAPEVVHRVELPLVTTAALLALAIPLGRLGQRYRVPAAPLLGGLAISAAAHLSGLAHGLAPRELTNPAYVVTGTMIGARFGAQPLASLWRLTPLAAGATVIAVGLAALFAMALALATGLTFAQAWIALAPGGVEAMAAMALALGFEPAFVAAHHLTRICFLSLVMPTWLDRAKRPRS